MHYLTSTIFSKKSRFFTALVFLAFGHLLAPASAQSLGQWDEIVGKRVVDSQGVRLGRVVDTVIDLEYGRYIGVLVESAGILGLGRHATIVPPAALRDEGRRTVRVDMDAKRFRAAPTFAMSRDVGPPSATRVAELYRYFGVRPNFATNVASKKAATNLQPLGFIQPGSKIRNMTVENLQGRSLGTVMGFRRMDRATGAIAGIIITPEGFYGGTDHKIVAPQTLRYNPAHTRLRLNDQGQEFSERSDFTFVGGRKVIEERPSTSGITRSPMPQGSSEEDKRITLGINNQIRGNGDLSHYAKNVEVGTVRGKTTVRSRVETPGERDEIVQAARAVAGPANVTNQLEVRPMTASEEALDTDRAIQ